ncbi:PREDICTED: uncharacterized protein LOC108749674 isoform X1 [Trachymyrmex septentrionalis]|uniref:uncharacterized protein LOC108749674 isoform X1 n=2 Tax=Trachymyrmex septentrionalis TaxID=34720 RepID=UPI00084F374F|nr:PREDICTED: uncharacterized protein LOC108749674 isoform X1 [Trachymyrmex septentrionalis]XP_018344014.1 PREDICTED: uncharacterized protein LOC108749674 isoform X1 [Trachymyrmex septentrionalis]XP_018344015.1 PREDICTED: uncharacterized protein LOC108749674 isoform X1 [Trachymyrmex septentrionalis]XP_018344016.1 PREDICTED: uncharacterized protein LOC108749674 isoform X1 [Trachymyrmex septentrionalis]XP_018344017.1 PREDICTED: uncharacterized protein LOC108749674 isoform X1 [Trachymyrmex septent
MRKTERFSEDKLPFLNEDKNKIIDLPYVYIEDPIRSIQHHSLMLKGTANHLRRWPNDLFSSFMAACLVLLSFIFLAFVTAIFCSPITNTDNCCDELKISEDECSINVYFVKEATQVWSGKEFCYIEAAAREQPNLNVYLINLMRTSSTLNTSEIYLKMALTTQNANIHIAEILINKFFSKTKLSSIAKNLNNELLLMAARAYLLWNFPGVAMHPSAYCNLSVINKSRWNKVGKRDCMPDKLVTIDPTIDLQATDVHCQAFLGFLMQEISKNATQIYSLKDALNKFCPRIDNCTEVRVLDLKSHCSVNAFDCPTVYKSGKSWELTI